jgi:hypothetical protein
MTPPTNKSETLKQFAWFLFENDPMQLKVQDRDEYESEALTILARFNEAGFQIADSAKDVVDVATEIVTQAFEFWFADELSVDFAILTRGLLDIYLNSYGVTLDDLSKAAPEAHGGSSEGVEHVTVG